MSSPVKDFFNFVSFLMYVAPFLCIGLGIFIGWLIWG